LLKQPDSASTSAYENSSRIDFLIASVVMLDRTINRAARLNSRKNRAGVSRRAEPVALGFGGIARRHATLFRDHASTRA
jgi:hypothetical protein